MTAVRPAGADAFLARLPPAVRAVLLYGPDAGLVSERARAAAGAFLGPAGLADGLVRITAEDLRADAGRLADEIGAVSLFGGRRVLLVRPEGHDVARLLAERAGAIDADTLVVVEAGDLKATAPLRKLFEREAAFAAIPCYADDARGLAALIDAELAADGLAAEADARAFLLDRLGADRLASRMELAKLKLYARGQRTVSLADAAAVTGDAAALELDAALDALGLGEAGALDRALRRLLAAGSAPAQIAAAALRHFLLLHALRCEADAGRPARAAVEAARPPVFFRRREAVARQVSLWPRARLEAALERLHEAERLSRRSDRLAEAGLVQTLLEVCAAAAAAQRRAG